jgi:hypothetical protein
VKEKVGRKDVAHTIGQLPLAAKFADHVFRREVEVNLRGGQPVMA